MNDQIAKKLTDTKFTKKIIGLKTKDEVKKAFEDEGITISNEQLDELGDKIRLIVEEAAKLPPEDLEKISGGMWPFDSPVTTMGMVNNVMMQPGVANVAVAGTFGVITALINAGATWYATHNAPPPKPQPLISQEAMTTGAIIAAVLGSGYVINQLIKSGWFEESTKKVKKKSQTTLPAGGV